MTAYQLAKQALERRIKAIGKDMSEIMPQEVHELCTLASRDITRYPNTQTYDQWMTYVVSSGGPGILRLNI